MSDANKLTSREAIKLIKSWRRRIKPDWIDFDDILARVTDEPEQRTCTWTYDSNKDCYYVGCNGPDVDRNEWRVEGHHEQHIFCHRCGGRVEPHKGPDEPDEPEVGCSALYDHMTGCLLYHSKVPSPALQECLDVIREALPYVKAADEPEAVEPVTPQDWCDETADFWRATDERGLSVQGVRIPGPFLSSPIAFVDTGGNEHLREQNADGLHSFIPLRVTVPPIAEPEPVPEKPVLLLAKSRKGWEWLQHKVCVTPPTRNIWHCIERDDYWNTDNIIAVDRDHSDPEALEIYDREVQSA
jgi:hypothetical protein